jgi:tetratricopeptide (TPR) repeat protein
MGFMILLAALPSWCQKSGSPGKGGSGPASPGTGSLNPSVSSTPAPQPALNPFFVKGRILMETGQPVPEPVSVALQCGIRQLQVIKSDLKGYFEFTLGDGPQGNADISASDDASISPGSNGAQFPSSGTSQSAGLQNVLTGCEVHVTVSGYQPMSRTITGRSDITGVDVGTLQLTRLAGVTGSSISVTSLQVPDDARKEFEKGEKDARSNHLDSATQHLEKAVARYDKYAAAWDELGSLYATSRATEKSHQAFQKAIDADPHYIPPYIGLAELEMQNQEFEAAVDTAGKALQLDPSIGAANYIQAVGNLKLNRLDAADKSAQMAEKVPHASTPDLHALHASILIQKQDYQNAAAQMRAYLKEFPQGRFADQMKNELQQIAKLQGSDAGTSGSAQPQIAP